MSAAPNEDGLAFNSEAHAYTWNGFRVPSVTQVLSVCNDLTFINPARLEAARDFGHNVHLMTDLFDRGELDEATLDLNLLPYLTAYKQFLFDTHFTVETSEERLFHPTLLYAGTSDKRGKLRKASAVLDIKSGVFMPAYVGAQTAGYQQLVIGMKPKRRLCLQLMLNRYKLHSLTDPADWPFFVSCLNLWQYLNRRKLHHD